MGLNLHTFCYMKTFLCTLITLITLCTTTETQASDINDFMDRIDASITNPQFVFKGIQCRYITNQSFENFRAMTLCKSVSFALDTLEKAFENTKRRVYMRLYDMILRTNYIMISEESIMCSYASAFARMGWINSTALINPKLQTHIDSLIEGLLYEREYYTYFCPKILFPGGLDAPSEAVIHEAGHSHGFGECLSESLSIMATVDSEVQGTKNVSYKEKCSFGDTWESAVEKAKTYLDRLD